MASYGKILSTVRAKNESKDESHFHHIKYLMSVQVQLSPKYKMLLSSADKYKKNSNDLFHHLKESTQLSTQSRGRQITTQAPGRSRLCVQAIFFIHSCPVKKLVQNTADEAVSKVFFFSCPITIEKKNYFLLPFAKQIYLYLVSMYV